MAIIYAEQQALTRTPSPPTPTTLATNVNDAPPTVQGSPVAGDGLRTTNLLSLVVTCVANTNNTLLGGGTLQCWVLNAFNNLWCRMPDLDLSLSWGTSSAQQAKMWPALRNPSRLGARINFLTSGVTVSGGTDVLVIIQGFTGPYPS